MSEQRISVAVRIRPPLEKERYEPLCARKADDDMTIMIKPEENAANMGEASAFQFDNVFDENDFQQDVYEESVQELVDHALSGFNATVFTYGQTGSGKTFTILGKMSPDGAVNEQSGVFLRVFNDLFNYKASVQDKVHIVVTLSALELYVEDVMDLLANKNKLKLRETPEETLTMGICTVEVQTMEDVVRNFEVANSFRSVTATKMNDQSSRSHALFFIDLFQIPVEKCPTVPPLSSLIDANGSPIPNAAPGLVRSRIALVDLAGSERVKRSGVTGQGMVEAQAINKSLSTLGTVINAMYVQSSHIPFRESKLTKLLKTSLVDPTSRLLLIGQVAPPTNSAQESLSTLRFCDRVKGLKAGQVMGFSDPAEEERYLHSMRLNEELTAEMRILRSQFYYEPVNLRALAAVKGTSPAEEQQRVMQELQAGAADLQERKEREILAQMERDAALERDAEVEKFVLHMNALIEEYEVVAVATKKEKKALKKLAEELEVDQEAKVHEAKKAKKHRIKLEEQHAELVAQVEGIRQIEENIDQELLRVHHEEEEEESRQAAVEEAGSNPDITPEMEEATHRLVESFYNNCLDMNRLYALYVTRLAQTGHQRSLVKRQKLLSSTLVTESSLLPDILAFLVDRAVDIAEGDIPMSAKWSWYDVDGLSRVLPTAEQLYPPLIEYKEEYVLNTKLAAGRIPIKEESHKITFLSSDESDDENSHHAAETRRQRKIKIRNGLQVEVSSSEDGDDDLCEGDDNRERTSDDDFDEERSTPIPKAANWLNAPGTAEANNGNADDGDEAAAAAAAAKEERRRKRREERKLRQQQAAEEAGAGVLPGDAEVNGVAAAEDDGNTKKHKKHRRKSGDDDETEAADAEEPGATADGAVESSKKRKKHHRTDAKEEDDVEDNSAAAEEAEKAKRHKKAKAGVATAEESGTSDGDGNEDDNDSSSSDDDSEAGKRKPKNGKPPRAAKGKKDKAGKRQDDGEEDAADPQAMEVLAVGPDGEPLPRKGKLSRQEADRLYVMRVYDSPNLIQELLKFLRSGAVMLKHGRNGKPHDRLFWILVAKDRRDLLWRDPKDRKATPSKISLDEVSYIQLGAFTKVFNRHKIHPHDPSFFRSFTIGLKGGGRTVDVVARSVPDYEAWVVGLSHLVAVDPAWGGKLDVTKEPGYERLNYFESILCEQNYLYPSTYLTLKKAVQNVAVRTLEVLQANGNDRKKAFEQIGGIHLPGINEKGAVYLTKGELRYLCPELKLDIFRITHVWMHFQQTNLVYDDHFVPATPFGVTRRE